MAELSTGANGDAKGKGKGRDQIDLEEAMRRMNLKDTELDDVFVGEVEIADLSKLSRWLAITRVNTRKFFCHNSFKGTMRYVWNLAHKP